MHTLITIIAFHFWVLTATVSAAPATAGSTLDVTAAARFPISAVDADLDTVNGTFALAARTQYGASCEPLDLYPYNSGSWALRGGCKKKNHKMRCSMLPLENCITHDGNNNLIGSADGGHIRDCTSCQLDGSRYNQWMRCSCNGHETDWFNLNDIVGNNDGWLQCYKYNQHVKCE